MTPEQLKASILQRAMEGKLVPQDPTDEPASELLKRIKVEKEKLIADGKIKRDKKETELFRGADGKPYEKLADGTVKEVEVPYDIPDSWEWVKLKEIALVKSSKRVLQKDYAKSGIPFYRSKEIGNLHRNEDIITELFITDEHYQTLQDSYGVPIQGDILITSVGSIGNTWICDERKFYYKDGNITQICSNEYFNSYFIERCIHSPFFWEQVTSTVSGTAYSALTIIKLNNILFPLPPLSEQKRIVEQIERALEKVEVYAESYNKLQELDRAFPDKLKKSILQYAMQGKLVPQDPKDEPVEVLLEKIQTEKQKLYEEGKLKKKDLAEIVVEKGDDNSPYGKNGNFDMDFHRKSNWLLLPLEKVVVSVPTKNHQIKHSDIKSIGMFPVVSQSQVLVEGFSDDKTKVLDNQEHLIIFGDHTRTVKLIDFSFIVGADGVKILQPIGISPQFLKYHLECTILFVKDRGYARHYSYLKNKLIGIPSTDEQNKITNKIDLLFEKVAQL